MSSSSHIQKIAIAGASGNMGSKVLSLLLESKSPDFHVTAISRAESSATFPSAANLTVAKGDVGDAGFLTETLKGQDALIIIYGFQTPPEHTDRIIDAAAAAGVEYIVPTEFGSDTANPLVTDALPMLGHKVGWRQRIARLGVSKSLHVVTNPWTDFCLKVGLFGIDIAKRTATVATPPAGQAAFAAHGSSMDQAARAIAVLLRLERAALDGIVRERAGYVYVDSYRFTNAELLRAVQGVVGAERWAVQEVPLPELMQKGEALVAQGDMVGSMMLLGALTWDPQAGEYLAGVDNATLGLPAERLEDVVRRVVEEMGLPLAA